jgi:hypothetical protein
MLLFEAGDLLGGNFTILERALFEIECCMSGDLVSIDSLACACSSQALVSVLCQAGSKPARGIHYFCVQLHCLSGCGIHRCPTQSLKCFLTFLCSFWTCCCRFWSRSPSNPTFGRCSWSGIGCPHGSECEGSLPPSTSLGNQRLGSKQLDKGKTRLVLLESTTHSV